MISNFLHRFSVSYFFTTPEDSKLIFFWLGLYLLVLVLSFVLLFIYKERAKTEKPYKNYGREVFWINFTLSFSGLLFLLFRYEKANFLSYRIWHYLIFLAIVLVNPYLFTFQRQKLEANLTKYRDKQRKDKWLRKAK
jgi:hypothetical protein